jgi:hypothetical protein
MHVDRDLVLEVVVVELDDETVELEIELMG